MSWLALKGLTFKREVKKNEKGDKEFNFYNKKEYEKIQSSDVEICGFLDLPCPLRTHAY